jgi:hypothetical protein
MLHKCRALRAVYVSMAQAVDMYTNHLNVGVFTKFGGLNKIT